MPIFQGASGVTISGGSFNNAERDMTIYNNSHHVSTSDSNNSYNNSTVGSYNDNKDTTFQEGAGRGAGGRGRGIPNRSQGHLMSQQQGGYSHISPTDHFNPNDAPAGNTIHQFNNTPNWSPQPGSGGQGQYGHDAQNYLPSQQQTGFRNFLPMASFDQTHNFNQNDESAQNTQYPSYHSPYRSPEPGPGGRQQPWPHGGQNVPPTAGYPTSNGQQESPAYNEREMENHLSATVPLPPTDSQRHYSGSDLLSPLNGLLLTVSPAQGQQQNTTPSSQDQSQSAPDTVHDVDEDEDDVMDGKIQTKS